MPIAVVQHGRIVEEDGGPLRSGLGSYHVQSPSSQTNIQAEFRQGIDLDASSSANATGGGVGGVVGQVPLICWVISQIQRAQNQLPATPVPRQALITVTAGVLRTALNQEAIA